MTIQERFEEFHRLNPQVYALLVKMSRDLLTRGHLRCGIGMLWEVIRWRTMMRTIDVSSDFKLNDHYRSRYARRMMEDEPDLVDFFELRELRTA